MYNYFANLQFCSAESLRQGPLRVTLISPSASDYVAQVGIFRWCLCVQIGEKLRHFVGSSKKKLYFSES